MGNKTIYIRPVKELLEYSFFIPAYQRGYRWTKQQVEELLSDISDFTPKDVNENEKTWYCLQPLVLKQCNDKCINKNNLPENTFEVIDGQQRLTTIFLIGHYINQKWRGEDKDKEIQIFYKTRENSQIFLKNLKSKKSNDEEKVFSFINTETLINADSNELNIDFYHILEAYQTVIDWVNAKKKKNILNQDDFINKFQNYTKVIWFETTEKISVDIFTRINIGKIPLTNSELIKAKFLNSSNFKNDDDEKIRLKQLEIASEWDKIENSLHKFDFWYFINRKENEIEPRIEYIFDMIADKPDKADEFYTFRFFSNKFQKNDQDEIEKNWKEIKRYYQTLEEWFNDRELYHKIGFLITEGTIIKELIRSAKNKSKNDFKLIISNKVKEQFDLNENDLLGLEYKNRAVVKRALLLFNIETLLNNELETSRFPFDRYKLEKWDIEHIHSIQDKMPKADNHQQNWLKDSKQFINNDDNLKSDIGYYINNKPNKKSFEELYKKVLEYFGENSKHEDINDISNLALLDSKTNRGYGNAIFPVKRKIIIDNDKTGTFIPICTKNAFLKYYSPEVEQMSTWNSKDREDYISNIKNTLSKYFK